MNLPNIIMEINWSNISSNWSEFAISGYDSIFGNWFYPLVFLGIAGYIYCINKSAISTAALICIVFAVFGVTGIFRYPDIAEYSLLSWIVVIVSFSALFTTLFIRRYR